MSHVLYPRLISGCAPSAVYFQLCHNLVRGVSLEMPLSDEAYCHVTFPTQSFRNKSARVGSCVLLPFTVLGSSFRIQSGPLFTQPV